MARTNALQELEKAVKGQKPEAAWGALARAWAQAPAPELLEVARLLQAAFPAAPFAGDQAAWLKKAQKPSFVERGALLATMRTPRLQEMAERLQAVAGWSPDPRTSLWVEQLLRDAPFTSDSSKKTWKDAFALLAGLGEPRFVPLVAEAEQAWTVRESMKAWLGNQLREAVAPLGKLPAPDLASADAKVVASLQKALATQAPAAPAPQSAGAEEKLLAAVYANPADDAPRATYAAYLTQAGDLRGEFITLSLLAKPTPQQKQRKAELLKLHGSKWLGALAPAIYRKTYRFDRGFLSEVSLEVTDEALWKKVEAVQEWRTLREVYFYWENEGRIARLSEPMRGIPRLRGLGDDGIRRALATKRPWAAEELEANMKWPTWKAFVASGLFPNLKRFSARDLGIPRGLREMTVPYLEDKPFRKFLVEAEKSDLQTIRSSGIYTRDAQGWITDLTVRVTENNGGWRIQEQDKNAQAAEAWCAKQKWLKGYRVIKQKAMT